MKKIFCFILLICSIQFVQAQLLPDSLLAQYKAAGTDAEKGRKLSDFLYVMAGNPGSQINQTLQIHSYFQKKNDSVGADYCELNLARILERSSDYASSLKFAFPVYSRFENRNDLYGMMRSLNAIGNALENSQNVEQGIVHYKKTLPIALAMGDKTHYAYALNNIGAAYAKINQPDSALLYSQRAVNMAKEVDDPTFITYAISTLGESYLAQGENEIARPFLRKGYDLAKLSSDYFALCYACNDLAQSFLATGEQDSTRIYAQQAVHYSLLGHYRDQTLRAFEYLYRSFEKTNTQDSINKYFRLAMTTKDTLYSIEKTRNIQAMGFQEQIRQMEIETEKNKALEEQKHNVQFAAIAVGLMIFLSIFLILSRTIIVNEKWISFIGVLGLLVVFEFINLVIHPYLGEVTHHTPILMLMVLVAIAALLIPLHHRLEKWVKERMVEKNRKIRLAAAKKTIQKLEKEKPE
jgi:tetratricopeptide (TPR) repeat protein